MKINASITVTDQHMKDQQASAINLLSQVSDLPKKRLKDALAKGAVSVKRGNSILKIRKADTRLKLGDQLHLHYDENLLSLKPPHLSCLDDRMGYSVWYKPAGVMSQGTQFGDHMSILRIVEKQFSGKRDVFLVHRLDRETRGIMILAHNKKMAAIFSRMFQEGEIEKSYQTIVKGKVEHPGTVNLKLDDKNAITHYQPLKTDEENVTSLLDLQIETGRTHQIRRHLESIDHPVMGDPKYGKGNKNKEGLMLCAYKLEFICPIRHQPTCFALPNAFPGY